MRIRRFLRGDVAIAEIVGKGVLVATAAEALEVMVTAECDRIVLHAENLSPEFFRLVTGVAGEVMQKFVNYGVRVAIVGNLDSYAGESLKALVRESRRGGPVVFVDTLDQALDRLAGSVSV